MNIEASVSADFYAHVQRILEAQGGLWTIEDVLSMVAQGQMQSFTTEDRQGWMVTRVCEFPRRTVVDVVFVYGKERHFDEFERAVENFAREVGASAIMGTGRFGWKAKMTEGWRAVSVNYFKEV